MMLLRSTRMRGLRLVAALLFASLVGSGAAFGACSNLKSDVPRFMPRGGEALDLDTGLTWQRCALGTEWDGRGCVGERKYLRLDAAIAAAKAAGSNWRLPDIQELWGLRDDGCGARIDPVVFPGLVSGEEDTDQFWTSTPVQTGKATYFIDLAHGFADGHDRGVALAVLLVRRGH